MHLGCVIVAGERQEFFVEPATTTSMHALRLTIADRVLAKKLFAMIQHVFGEPYLPLGDDYLDGLLGREDFWAIAALAGDEIVGGLTAHTLPMTRSEAAEVFIYDIAVHADHRRTGVGGLLISTLREAAHAAGVHDAFVSVDTADDEAIAFYRAVGGAQADVMHFTFAERAASESSGNEVDG
jgi:aminoglycoside 3-N-acetyltransferase I